MFPLASVAVKLTKICPTFKVSGASFKTDCTAQLSFAEGKTKLVASAKHPPEMVFKIADGGQEMLGSSTSFTVTVCWQVEVFPLPSVAVQVTVVSPAGKVVGASFSKVKPVEQAELLAVGKPRFGVAEQFPEEVFAATLAGQVTAEAKKTCTILIFFAASSTTKT